MNSPTLISVVIPTYNRAKLIVGTLETVLNQTYRNFEILVVDNCSTDGTEEVLQPYIGAGQLKFIKHDQNYERARSRNTGMANATGDFLTFLDSDDFLYPTCFEDAVGFIRDNPGIKCFHNLNELVNTDREVVYRAKFPSIVRQLQAISNGNFMSCIGNFIHRDIYQNYEFDTFQPLTGAEDWDFWLRVLADNKLGRLEKVNCGILHHPDRSIKAHNISELADGYSYFFKKFRDDKHLSTVYAPYLGRIEASSYLYLATLANSAGLFADAARFIKLARKADPSVMLTRRFVTLSARGLLRWQIR
jgi:glycosyltransferase involved in cell wall biosynthesis